MGAWGTDTFENDSACDWSHDLEDFDGLELVEQAIAAVLGLGPDDVGADVATEALAACDVVARLKGRFGVRDAYTESVDAWVANHRLVPSPKLVARALAVVDRVVARPSELLELWEEGGEEAAWLESVAGLRKRIAG